MAEEQENKGKQRRWTQDSWKSIPQQRAEELEAICKEIVRRSRLKKRFVSDDGNSHDRLRSLCNLIHGTDELKDYVFELLESGELKGFPRLLFIAAAKGLFGLFDLLTTKQYERLQILYNQPAAIEKALQSGDWLKAARLQERNKRWKRQFEKHYKESVFNKCTRTELLQDIKKPHEVAKEGM